MKLAATTGKRDKIVVINLSGRWCIKTFLTGAENRRIGKYGFHLSNVLKIFSRRIWLKKAAYPCHKLPQVIRPPDYTGCTSDGMLWLLQGLDIIEIGHAFSEPRLADGPVINWLVA